MKTDKQDDLRAIAHFTKAIVRGTGDMGAQQPNYKHEVVSGELANNVIGSTVHAYKEVDAICLAAKAQMVRACAAMLSEVEGLDAATKKATSRLNDVSGRIAQSLEKTKQMMGPNVEDRLRQLERLVECLERLQKLDSDGVVARFGIALGAGK